MKKTISYLFLFVFAVFVTRELRPLLHQHDEFSFILVALSVVSILGMIFWKRTQLILKGSLFKIYFVLSNYIFDIVLKNGQSTL